MGANGRRAFTAELQRGRHVGGAGEAEMLPATPALPPDTGVGAGADGERLDRLEAKLDQLAEKIDTGGAPAAPAPAASDDEKDARIAQLEADKKELEAALQAEREKAETTRQELAALKPNEEIENDRLELAEKELQAIVASTEGATETILGYCEELEDQAEALKQSAPSAVVEEQADSIREAVTEIYQAANFQDLTGQRVTKVINTLAFVEDRVGHMKHTWQMEGGEAASAPPELGPDDEAHLLNGPALEDEGLSQDDIDAMFD